MDTRCRLPQVRGERVPESVVRVIGMANEPWKCPYGYRSACDICELPKGPLCGHLWDQWQACLMEAQRSGHTAKEAEECDDCGLECPECPFVTK